MSTMLAWRRCTRRVGLSLSLPGVRVVIWTVILAVINLWLSISLLELSLPGVRLVTWPVVLTVID
jgi:hypothetical protein